MEKVTNTGGTSPSDEQRPYRDLLEGANRPIRIVDAETREILYENAAARDEFARGAKPDSPHTCYGASGLSDPCENCPIDPDSPSDQTEYTRYEQETGRWIHVTGKPIIWDGRRAFVHYIDDVTAQETMKRRYEMAFDDLARAYPNSLGTFHLNLTKNWVGEGKSPLDFVLKQQESGTADGYFAEFSKLIADDKKKAWFLDTFDREKLIRDFEMGRTQISFEYPIIYADGTRHWREGLLTLARNPTTGDIEGVTYAIDIDDRKASETMSKALIRDVFDFIILLDMKTGMIINGGGTERDARERYEDEDYETAMRAALEAMMPPESLDAAIEAHSLENIRERLAHDSAFEVTLSTTDHRLLHWRIIYADREQDVVLIMRENITEVAKNEQQRISELEKERQARQHTSALLQSILDTVPTSVFWKDKDRRFEGANRAFLDFYEFDSLDDILGKNDEDMGWHPDPSPYKNDEFRVIEDGVSTHRVPGEYMSRGKLCHIVASKSPRYENGEIVGLVGSFEDVTKEYERDEEITRLNADLSDALDKAEAANAAEQTFLSNMSHDMRTPLNGIIGFTELALSTDDHDKRQDYLGKIDASGELMLSMVNDVLDMSKIESGKMELRPEPIDSHELFDTILDTVILSAQKRNIELKTRIDEKVPRFVNADPLRLQQIALNLLSNAIKYTPDGGSVSYVVQMVDPSSSCGCNTRLTVQDNGIGMSEEFQERMFEPFSQEHQSRMYGTQGTGLGLSIVRSITEIMGGHIDVRSKLGKGSTFDVYLPIEAAEVGNDSGLAGHHATRVGSISGRKILLVEDNKMNAEIAETILRERGGALVDHARDGREGLDLFEASDIGQYDAVLMDVRMPVMDGLAATRAIRALDRPDATTVPIVAMTADAFAEDIQSCIDAGMDSHLAKPIDPRLLFSTLSQLFDKRESGTPVIARRESPRS